MIRARTIPGLLRERARSEHADCLAIRFLEGNDWIQWSWRKYWASAESAAASLLESGVHPGDHVLLLTPDVRPAAAALFGLWTIGAVAIQIGFPFQLQNRAEFMGKLADTARRLDARFLLTAPAFSRMAPQDHIRVLTTDRLFEPAAIDQVPDPDEARGNAFIQLTSGSTSHPRGVMVQHDRLMLHMRSMSECLPSHSESAGVSWLPLHHDMGLLGGLLFPFYNGFPAHLISTADFQARPWLWLETMSRFRGTITAAPPSAYAMCVQLAPRLLNRGLNLSCWECAMVGAEPISPSLLERFGSAFAPAGFRSNAFFPVFFPVYGLAEATVAVSFPRLLEETRMDRVDRTALECNLRAIPSSDPQASRAFVGVGKPVSKTEIRITGPDGASLPERYVGELCIRSATLAIGYYGEPEATEAAFRDGWLHTGDLGYLADGTLFVTGRKKEIIIKGGQNLIPSVLEEIAGAVTGVRAVAAVGVHSPELQTELVYIVAETRCEPAEHPELGERVRLALKAEGVAVDKVVLLAPKSLPKTTSGKLQRVAIASMMATRFA
jgi:acyl-CoA synthetase (AMP-forming)/AMP-acid ligase II